MTSPTCRQRGGDFSVWVVSVMQDAPELLRFFQASKFGDEVPEADKPRNEAILAGYRMLADQLTAAVPAGYCVDDLRRWTGADPSMRPFGFPWGVTEGDGHQSMYYCTDREPGATAESESNRWFGAERAACDGFYLQCRAGLSEADQQRCAAWNTFSDDFVRRVDQMRGRAIDEHPATGIAETDWSLRSPEEILRQIAGNWFQELTYTMGGGAASVLGEAMTFWTRTDRSAMFGSPAIAEMRGLFRYVGIALLAGGMMWQGLLMTVRRKADPLVSTGLGLLSYVGWSTLAGSIAVMLNEAGVAFAGYVLDDRITEFSTSMQHAMMAGLIADTGAVFLLALVVFALGCIQWGLGFFQAGALMMLLALVPTAAAGQLSDATKPWLRKVLSWSLALILYQPLAACIYAMGFTFMSDGQDLETLLVGVAILVLAAVCMPALMRFFDWGGQQLVASAEGRGGGAMAAGAAASVLGGGGSAGFARLMDQSGPGSGGSGTGAATVSPVHAGEGPGASAATGSGTAAATAAAGPAGAIVAAADQVKAQAKQAVNTAAAAMTSGADQVVER